MVGSNKILTVSYGTFSCTLEGFDDSFGTMKAIAEYFRDLAADDRYFGAEPPTPDAEMLARIAEREVARRVEARLDAAGRGIVLRVDNTVNGALGADRVAEAAPVAAPMAAPEARAVAAEAPVAEVRAPAMPPAPSYVEAPRPALANDSVAAKLARIRAVVNQAATSSLVEDEPVPAAVPEEPAAVEPEAQAAEMAPEPAPVEAAVEEHAVEPAAVEEPSAVEAEAPEAPEAPEAAVAEEPVAVEAAAEPEAVPAEEPAPEPVAEPEAMGVEAPAAEAEAEAVAPAEAEAPAAEPAATEAPSTAIRPRVIRMRRADFDEAVAAGVVDAGTVAETATEAVAEPSPDPVAEVALVAGPLPPDVEADLQAELAAIEAEVDGSDEADAALAVAGLMATVQPELRANGDRAEIEAEGDAGTESDAGEPAAEEVDVAAWIAGDDAVAAPVEAEAEDVLVGMEPEAEEEPTTLVLEPWEAEFGVEAPVEAAIEAEVEAEAETALSVGPEATDEVEAGNEPAVEAETVSVIEEASWEDEAQPQVADAASEGSSDESLQAVLAAMRSEAEPGLWTPAPEAEATLVVVAVEAEASVEDVAEAADEPAFGAADADESQAVAAVHAGEEAEPSEEPALRARRPAPEGDDEAVARLLSRADAQLAEPEMSRRREAIAQLRAAVAATEAARRLGEEMPSVERRADPFREDLRQAVRPRRPVVPSHATERPRPAPLKLVASQRVDLPEARPVDAAGAAPAIRPRRVTVEAATPEPAPRAEAEVGRSSFQAFAAEMGATTLTDILEAAAAYTAFVEGAEDFSRPQIIDRVRQVAPTAFSREDGLRSFGTLLRQGTITRVRGGRFQVTGESRFNPSRRAG